MNKWQYVGDDTMHVRHRWRYNTTRNHYDCQDNFSPTPNFISISTLRKSHRLRWHVIFIHLSDISRQRLLQDIVYCVSKHLVSQPTHLSSHAQNVFVQFFNVFSCDQAALRTLIYVCPSVCLSVGLSFTPFDYVPINVSSWNFSLVITNYRSDVQAKGKGHRSKVKVRKFITQLIRSQTVTQVWIHIWCWNDA